VADGRQIENHFVGYNSAPYCPTKMKFGMRRYNRTLTKVRWWKCQFRKRNVVDGRHFENRYISIPQPRTVRIWRNLVCWRKFWPRRRKRDKNSEILKFKMVDGRHIENQFSAITRLHIVRLRQNLEFGGIIARTRRLSFLRWWKCQISKIQHGGQPPFWKSLYLHISVANRPSFTKFSMQTQILPQATETRQNSELRKFKMPDERRIENHLLAIT